MYVRYMYIATRAMLRLDRGTCGTFLTAMHASSTLLRNDSNRAHVEPRQFLKKRRLASTFALEGGAGEGPREMFMIIRV
jgi:hypothetical protein